MLRDPGAERACRHGAAVARQFPSAAQQDHCRYRLDLIARREARLSLGIDLAEAQARLEFFCRSFKHRRHGAAWPAPGGPEINEQGQIGRAGVAIEMRRIEADRMSLKKCLVALPAFAAFASPLGRNAIERVAMRTGNGDGDLPLSFSPYRVPECIESHRYREPGREAGARQRVGRDCKDHP